MAEVPALDPELRTLVEYGRELRGLEYKRSISWNDQETKLKVARTALAMSNTENGGAIVLGLEEGTGGLFSPNGLKESDFESFRPDDVIDYVNRFADPPIEMEVAKGNVDGRLFVIIRVSAFREIPTICKRNGGQKNELREGAIYTRPFGKPQSAEVKSQTEMREIIDRAVDKARLRFATRSSPSETVSERTRLEREIQDLL